MDDIWVTGEAYKYEGGPLLLLAGPGTGSNCSGLEQTEQAVLLFGI
ncbi:MAG TPA: hypothetical protein VMT23_00375 [Candidatus Binatia bacterium]|nr:hypothetical protein [Candidatus Binatia bacterium]